MESNVKYMNVDDFKVAFQGSIADRLYEENYDVSITARTCNKLNDSYNALTITPAGSNIGVNLNIEKFFDAYNMGRFSYDEIVNEAINVVKKGISEAPSVEIDKITNYENMKNKLCTEIVSVAANEELLSNVPHKEIEDMAVVYRCILEQKADERATVLVTNNMLKDWNVSIEQLNSDAIANAQILKPAELKTMTEVMIEMMGADAFENMGMPIVLPEDEKMFVATVPDKIHGASVLAYPGFLENAAEKIGSDFYVLPSSIHEVLLVKESSEVSLSALESMVREVNSTQVAPEDKLTDNVYHYDSKDKIFELGCKYEARMNMEAHNNNEQNIVRKHHGR